MISELDKIKYDIRELYLNQMQNIIKRFMYNYKADGFQPTVEYINTIESFMLYNESELKNTLVLFLKDFIDYLEK